MDKHEKEKLVADLESGRQTLMDVLKGITEDLAARTPPGRWSILECVEHLAVSEDYLFSQIAVSHSSSVPVVNEKREALIVARGLDRTKPVSSPEVGSSGQVPHPRKSSARVFSPVENKPFVLSRIAAKTFAPN